MYTMSTLGAYTSVHYVVLGMPIASEEDFALCATNLEAGHMVVYK